MAQAATAAGGSSDPYMVIGPWVPSTYRHPGQATCFKERSWLHEMQDAGAHKAEAVHFRSAQPLPNALLQASSATSSRTPQAVEDTKVV